MTTIFESPVLDAYYANAVKYGRLEQVHIYVIPDRKTPAAVAEVCKRLREKGLLCCCPSLEEQEAFLKRVGFPSQGIQYNSDNRRNVGFLMALESGADLMVSIDDDNFCREDVDFFAEHSVVAAAPADYDIFKSATGFLNICSLLDYEKPANVYPRGFPYLARHRQETWTASRGKADIFVNAGLWLRDPDVDGMTWLVAAPKVTSFSKHSIVLGKDTWTPINSQNTALRRSVIPAYYFVRMKYSISGTTIDRHGDIFSGYFAEACVKQVGGGIRIGTPVVDHRRNSHDYLRDATQEMAGILLLEDILPWLCEARLSGSTCADAYMSLSYMLEDAVESFHGAVWTDATRAYFHQMAYWMRAWLRACKTILGA